jgi:tRNA1Val (adenine37-N6)-methyltransferase
MPNDYFQFKQFLVKQGRSAFKVGTDGVLLGAWASVENAGSILDVGTGTGLIALMLAQRTAAGIQSTAADAVDAGNQIVALEIEKSSCEQAMDNVRMSPWNQRIRVINRSFQDYCETESAVFDLIVSNPPFFSDSLKPENPGKEISRHDTLLGLGEMVSGVGKLLKPDGKFCVILPVEESKKLQKLGGENGLHLCRICRVSPNTNLPVKRNLLEFRRNPLDTVEVSEMAIEKDRRHEYTDAYRELTRDFYLAF